MENNNQSAQQSYAIYSISRTSASASFSSPQILPSPVNVAGYQSKQPMITSDGKHLLFSSNQPGGQGKFDIWKVAVEGNKIVGPAMNLGAIINTPGNEVTPYFHLNTQTLSFSSDGREGMGGLDIYQIQGSIEKNQWQDSILHLGAPFNSVKDDQYFRVDANTDIAYLSSDRSSTCCLELFKTEKIKEKEVLVENIKPKQIEAVIKAPEKMLTPVPSATVKSEEERLIDSINAITFIRRNVYYDFAKTTIRKVDEAQLNDIVQVLQKILNSIF